jgi:hypothetical protein
LKISGKNLALLMVVALGLLSHPETGSTQTVKPIVDLGSHVWTSKKSAGCLLGGKLGERWLKPGETASLLRGIEKYRLYSMTRFIGTATGSKAEKTELGGEPEYVVQIRPFPVGQKEIIAIGGQWNALPRVPRLVSPEQEIYKEAVADFLKKKGMKDPEVKITQVIRIDLDGDGVEEVLITATTYGEKLYRHLQEKGSYSLVLLRKAINGKEENVVIAEDYLSSDPASGTPMRYWVGAVLDVDGDGVMEIVLHAMYYEGGGTSVYKIKGGRVTTVMEAGWGL